MIAGAKFLKRDKYAWVVTIEDAGKEFAEGGLPYG